MGMNPIKKKMWVVISNRETSTNKVSNDVLPRGLCIELTDWIRVDKVLKIHLDQWRKCWVMVLIGCMTSSLISEIFGDLADRSWKKSWKTYKKFSPCMRVETSICLWGRLTLPLVWREHQLHQANEGEFNPVGDRESLKGFEQENGVIHNMLPTIKPGRWKLDKSEKKTQGIKQHDTRDWWFPPKYLCLCEKYQTTKYQK